MTKLAVSISAKDIESARQQISLAKVGGAEMLELRCDYLVNLSVALAVKLIALAREAAGELPLIVTCRDFREGGARNYPVELRIAVLVSALKAGAEYVDFEYNSFLSAENQMKLKSALAGSAKGRLIMSAHNFKGKFDDMKKLYRHIMTLYPVAIPKLVYTADSINDCFEGFDLLYHTSDERIVLCMGQGGFVSRIVAKKLGSMVSFASVDELSRTAPGQLSVKELKEVYRWDSIDSNTELYGVIAEPVGHSMSPAVHNACFDKIKANKLYLPLLVKGGKNGFELFMRKVLSREWLGFKGFSVTLPHKENALDYIKCKGGDVELLAERIGTVNTVTIGRESKVSGFNTDYAGALDAICSGMKIGRDGLEGMAVAVVGAGGVARAVVAGLSAAGSKVKIYNRTVGRAEKLAEDFNCEYGSLAELASMDAKLLINCSSVGMYPDVDSTPVAKECLKKGMVVFDTVYNPVETLFLRQAKEAGAKRIDGVTMFVNQALSQFKYFSGVNGDAKLMRKVICNCLGE